MSGFVKRAVARWLAPEIAQVILPSEAEVRAILDSARRVVAGPPPRLTPLPDRIDVFGQSRMDEAEIQGMVRRLRTDPDARRMMIASQSMPAARARLARARAVVAAAGVELHALRTIYDAFPHVQRRPAETEEPTPSTPPCRQDPLNLPVVDRVGRLRTDRVRKARPLYPDAPRADRPEAELEEPAPPEPATPRPAQDRPHG